MSSFNLFIFHFAVCFLLYLSSESQLSCFSVISSQWITFHRTVDRPHTHTHTHTHLNKNTHWTILELLWWFTVKLLNEAHYSWGNTAELNQAAKHFRQTLTHRSADRSANTIHSGKACCHSNFLLTKMLILKIICDRAAKIREQTWEIYSVQWEFTCTHKGSMWKNIHWRILLLGFQTFLSGWGFFMTTEPFVFKTSQNKPHIHT